MFFDAKKHEILVVKTQLMLGAADHYREMFLIKSGDDLDSLLRLVPESYHAAITNSKECVVHIKWAQLTPIRRCHATVEVTVRMPRHRQWSLLTPRGASWITCLKDESAIWTDEANAPVTGTLIKGLGHVRP
jgi:hypothetical protein